MRHKLNKRGSLSENFLIFIPRFIFLIVVLFSVVFLIRHFVIQKLDVQEVQADVFTSRFLYSSKGILYYDQGLKREVPGIIDPSKISDSVLDGLMQYPDDSFVAAKVTLFDVNKKAIVSATYNEKTYDRWILIARRGIDGPGGVNTFTKIQFINYFEDGTIKPGFIEINTLLPGK